MPLIKIDVSTEIQEIDKEIILTEAQNIIIEATGKSASHMMAILNKVKIKMSSTDAPAAFIEIRGIGGLTRSVNNVISKKISELLNSKLDIALDRIYLNFMDVEPTNWGWQGKTFA